MNSNIGLKKLLRQRRKKEEKEENLRYFMEKQNNVYVMGVPEIKDTEKGTENLFEIQWPKLQDFKSKKKTGYTNSRNLKDSN